MYVNKQQRKSGGWEGQEVGEGGVGAVAPFTILAFYALVSLPIFISF